MNQAAFWAFILIFAVLQASCRRIFSLDVVLLNAMSQAINKELEVCNWISSFPIVQFL